MESSRQSPFRYPYEHGAWWTFFTALVGGLTMALGRGAPKGALAGLAFGMSSFFLSSDWITNVVKHRGEQRPWGWKGPAFCVVGAALLFFGLQRAGKSHFGLGEQLGEGLLLWGLAATLVLSLRLKLPRRSLALLVPSALLLTAPAMLLAALAFGRLGVEAIGFWAFWAVFFASGVNYVQTWLRGAQLPRWRIYVASVPYLGLAGALAFLADYAGLVVLCLLSFRIVWRLRQRAHERRALESELDAHGLPTHMPTDPQDIRRLGWEQVIWSLVLGCLWTWSYLP